MEGALAARRAAANLLEETCTSLQVVIPSLAEPAFGCVCVRQREIVCEREREIVRERHREIVCVCGRHTCAAADLL